MAKTKTRKYAPVDMKITSTDLYTYKMPETMAKEYLANRRGEEAKIHPSQYLCDVVNSNFGVKGQCIEVITF